MLIINLIARLATLVSVRAAFDWCEDCDCIPSVNYSQVPIQEKCLHVPPLEEAVQVLSRGLADNFEFVNVSVVDSPDFTQPPYGLSAPGLCGDERLVDLGGTEYLVPLAELKKLYDLKQLAQALGRDPARMIGAAAGPWTYNGLACECIIDLFISNGTVHQGSRIVTSQPPGAPQNASTSFMEELPATETRIALLGNFLLSRGEPGKVVKIDVRKRTGSLNFVSAVRQTLQSYYDPRDQIVGIGGFFTMHSGVGTYHVIPGFPRAPVCTTAAFNRWLHFYQLPAPILHASYAITRDFCDLDLNVQHSHGNSVCGRYGGHYYNDTTPDDVRYEGFYTFAKGLIRVDQPPVASTIGRD